LVFGGRYGIRTADRGVGEIGGAPLALISQIMTIVGGLTRPAKSIFRVEACARGGG
jgi:hypothetical protein